MSDQGSDELGEKIARAKAVQAAHDAARKASEAGGAGSVSAGAHALRYGVEFVACVFVGGFIGYWIDHFAGTKPWGLLIVGALGFAAGIRAVWRAYQSLNAEAAKYQADAAASGDTKTDE